MVAAPESEVVTVADTQSFYGRWARAYDWFVRMLPGIDGLRSAATDALSLSPGDTAVDLGCGTGANLRHLRDRVGPTGTVVGVDLTAGMLARAESRVERAGWQNVHLVRGDAGRPPVADVDGILGSFVVGLLSDPEAAVQRWLDCLVDGGRVAVLEAGRSDHRVGSLLNPAFDVFVDAGSPSGGRDQPGTELDARIEATRTTLAEHATLTRDERRTAGFVHLVAAQRRGVSAE
jgi:ubiquinone/menaquinone biosynthesis C-methylase UbiE